MASRPREGRQRLQTKETATTFSMKRTMVEETDKGGVENQSEASIQAEGEKSGRLRWTKGMDTILIDMLFNTAKEGKKLDSSTWTSLTVALSKIAKEVVQSSDITNRLSQMKTGFNSVKHLKGQKKLKAMRNRGIHWDWEKLAIICYSHVTASCSVDGLEDEKSYVQEGKDKGLPVIQRDRGIKEAFPSFDQTLLCEICDQAGHSAGFCPLHCLGFKPADAPVKPNLRIVCQCCHERTCYLLAVCKGEEPIGYADFKHCLQCSEEHDTFLCPSTIEKARCRDANRDPGKYSHAFYVENLPTEVTELDLYRHFRGSPCKDVCFVSVHYDHNIGKSFGYVKYSRRLEAAEAMNWGNGDGSQFSTNNVIECYPCIY